MSERITYLLRHKLIALELACVPIAKAFDYSVYLVGSCLERADYRDVDVRCILDPEQWAGLFGALDPARPFLDPRWELLCMSISELLGSKTGLPVDFQFQHRDVANANHPGAKQRHPLGMRGIVQ